ncbi:hypothetical protein PINS_up007456 [Pythium insidiosum]|nr:hypothetical protein PINS_up007456 [Pythium insidiosum]
MDLEKLRLDQFRLEIPLWSYVMARLNSGNQQHNNAADDDAASKRPALRSAVLVSGLQLALSVNEPEKWIWMKEDNIERFQQAIVDAAAARVARANWWTTTVAQKLVELAARRSAQGVADAIAIAVAERRNQCATACSAAGVAVADR